MRVYGGIVGLPLRSLKVIVMSHALASPGEDGSGTDVTPSGFGMGGVPEPVFVPEPVLLESIVIFVLLVEVFVVSVVELVVLVVPGSVVSSSSWSLGHLSPSNLIFPIWHAEGVSPLNLK